MKVFDRFSCLLRYPCDADLFGRLMAENGTEAPQYSLAALQEEYVETFDFSPKAALTLTSHVAHSDSERSDLMDCLNTLLNVYGIERTDNSSPDYLPDVLKAYQMVVISEKNEEALCFINNLILEGGTSICKALEKKKGIYLSVIKELCSALRQEVSNV